MKSPVGTPLSLMVSVCTLFALLLVGGCKSEEKGRTASLPPPLVGVMTVEERNVPVSFTYAGQTEGSRAVEVRAQVSGILMRRAYDEGQYVKQGQLLFEIEPDTYRAALRQANGVMEQAQAKFTQARLKSDGTVAEITLADGTVYQTKGVITFIDKQVNTNTSVVAARAEFVNPDLFVLPGQFVRVTLSGMELVNAILIPQQAVIQTQKGSMVVVIGEGDKAEMRPVDLGDNYGDSFLLNKGVKAGERIVVEGGNKAVPGQPVRIQQASVQDAKLPDQPVGTGSDSGKAE